MTNLIKKITPIFLLIALTLFAYHTFLTGLDLGGKDARWYQYELHDAIIQLHHHIFPTYLEQSEFNFIGMPIIRAPYYYLFGQFINALTFGQFDSLVIQHLTILISAVAAALIMYGLLLKLAPNLRWFACCFAFFYVSCPGVMGLIYKLDMYNSFMVIPYLPIVIYGLIRSYQQDDYFSYVITAVALSLMWMGHPPIALWTSFVCALFYGMQMILLRRGFKALFVSAPLVLLLCLWLFMSVFSLGLGTSYVGQQSVDYAAAMVKQLRAYFPGNMLPLGQSSVYLQLGYTLWLTSLVSLFIAFRTKTHAVLKLLLICFVVLLLFLYPLPFLGHFLWTILPQAAKNITSVWPDQRFYIILSALAGFIGILALNVIYPVCSKYAKLIIIAAFFGLLIWNVVQSRYFFFRPGVNNSWIYVDNIFFHPDFVMQEHDSVDWEFAYDPFLKARLLNQQQQVIQDNEQTVIDQCLAAKKIFPLTLTTKDDHLHFLNIHLLPQQRYMLCLQFIRDGQVNFPLLVTGDHFMTQMHFFPSGAKMLRTEVMPVPIFIPGKQAKDLSVSYDAKMTPGLLKIQSYGLITYQHQPLPIQIDAFTPFKATVKTETDHNYLALFKEFYPGYQATVNGQPVTVLESHDPQVMRDKMILIPLPHRGINHVVLIYQGLPMMRWSFLISAIVWCLVLMYLAMYSAKNTFGKIRHRSP